MAPVAAFFAGTFGWGTAAAWGVGAAASAFTAGATFAGTILGGLTVKLLTSVALSALQMALAPSPSGGGLTITATLRGEDNPETIILGRYATSGQCVYVNSHGKSNRYLTHVVELCSAPGATLSRLILGDKWVTLGTTAHPEYGLPVLGDYEGHVWLRYYDGRQTAADPDLVAKYSADPDMPWASTAIGAGLCYAVMTFHYDQEDLPQVPSYRFELDGLPLYDIRKDSTAGGSGSQRLANPATWTQTNNPIVQAWNILRGIPLPGGEIYGGGYDLSMLPSSVWMAAMNRCDVAVPIAGGGTEPAYRAGIEAAMTQEPAQPLTEIFKACSATIADMGYAWTITVGAPGLPVYSFTDDDVIVSKSQTLDPFPSLSETYNAVSARYPAPGKLWETREAPLRKNAAAEASDAFGRRTASLTLPAVPYGRQVQRLTAAWLADERRFIRHILNLPADSSAVELTDTVDWTSPRNGYGAKIFSVYEISEDVRTGIRQMSLRERNPADYDWTRAQELPEPPDSTATARAPEAVTAFAASGVSITDSAGQARRPAIQISWDPELTGRGLRWQARFAGQTTVRLRGDTQRLDDGVEIISAGVLPARNYEVRVRLMKARKTAWSGWLSVTTPSVYIGSEDVSDTFIDEIEGIAALAGVTPVSALPGTGAKVNQIVMLVPPGRLYRWTGSAWTAQLYGGVEPGSLDIAAFAASIRPPELFATLPTTGNVAGRQVYRTSDHTMWRHNGSTWVNANATSLLVGQLTAGQIAAAAIGAEQLAAQAITAKHLAIGNFVNLFDGADHASTSPFEPVAATNGGLGFWDAVTTYQGQTSLGLDAAWGTGTQYQTREFPVTPGTEYYVEFWANRNAAWNGQAANSKLRIGNQTGALVADLAYDAASLTVGAWVKRSRTFMVPVGTTKLRITLTSDATAGWVRLAGFKMRERGGGELVVDGSIGAQQVTSGLLITNQAQIGAAIINNAHIVNASVDTLKIGNQAVSADWNSYTAAWLPISTGGLLDVQTLTISDPTVDGCRAWVTYSCQIGMTRSTAGRGRGEFWMMIADDAGAREFGYWEICQYLPAGVEMQLPVSMTRRVLLNGGTATIWINARNVDCDTFRFSNRRVEVNVMKR